MHGYYCVSVESIDNTLGYYCVSFDSIYTLCMATTVLILIL